MPPNTSKQRWSPTSLPANSWDRRPSDRWNKPVAEQVSPEREHIEPANVEQLWETVDVAEPQTDLAAPVEAALCDVEIAAEPVAEPEVAKLSASAPVSYLERYAGMFEDDADGSADSSRPQPPSQEPPHTNRHESPHDHATTADHHVGHGDEESVEQYMAKLLQRMRGESAGSSGLSYSSSVEAVESEASSARSGGPEAAEPAVDSTNEAWSTAAIVDEAASRTLLNNIEELKPKTPAPQFAADMRALRALANQSTRHAIGIHTARKLRRNALTRCVIAVLAIFAGLYLLVYSSSWWSLQFAGACVALFAALYWTKLTFGSLMRAIQVGAFQHFTNDDDEDPLNPPLPIDVDRDKVDRENVDH